MGKKLIIKGADFSTNAVAIDKKINITELITTLADNINGVLGNAAPDRKAVYPRFSIEQYRQLGFRFISINVKSLGCFPFVTSVGPTGNAQTAKATFNNSKDYIPKGVHTLNLDDINPTQSFIYFGLNINKSLADISSDNLSDYIEITMSKSTIQLL